ncbi:MAG TPA: STAS/SEC14 domain-containing protein [Terriglobales bacterium]|jgi:hypothetical protein
MQDRIRQITHQGKQILLVDFSHCDAKQILRLLPEIQDIITAQPRSSVLALGDFTSAQITREVADSIKKTLVFDRPHVKHTALVGIEHVPKVLVESFKTFSRRELPAFATREEALDWLVKD